MQLIDPGPLNGIPNFISPEWLHITKMMELNIEYVKRFYHNSDSAVKSNHILVQLIKNLNIPFVLPIDRYYQLLTLKSVRTASNLNLTTPYGSGRIFQEQFFKDNHEIIIGHEDSFDHIEAYKNWENIEPVELLLHPETNLDLPILDGTNLSIGGDACVISINMVKLGIMYKGFMDNELSKNLPTQKSIMQFVRMYVIPGMIRSYLNISLFNRLCNFKIGIKTPISKRNTHSFYIPTKLDTRIDLILKNSLLQLEKKQLYLSGLLANIPSFSDNKLFYTELPETLQNRQQLWALLYSKISFYIRLFDMNDNIPIYNKTYLNELKRMVSIFINNNEHNTPMTFNNNLSFKNNLDYVLSL